MDEAYYSSSTEQLSCKLKVEMFDTHKVEFITGPTNV